MPNEEVVKLAQGLSTMEWRALGYNVLDAGGWRLSTYHARLDDCVIEKGLLKKVGETYVTMTELGQQVWAWRALFWEGNHD